MSEPLSQPHVSPEPAPGAAPATAGGLLRQVLLTGLQFLQIDTLACQGLDGGRGELHGHLAGVFVVGK